LSPWQALGVRAHVRELVEALDELGSFGVPPQPAEELLADRDRNAPGRCACRNDGNAVPS
jgi:hypothetical protein